MSVQAVIVRNGMSPCEISKKSDRDMFLPHVVVIRDFCSSSPSFLWQMMGVSVELLFRVGLDA